MGRVEVFRTGRMVTVYSDGLPVQAWAVDEWDELLAAIKADDDCLPEIEVLPTGDVWLGFQYSGRHEILSFTEAEWAEFVADVRADEFDVDKLSGPAAAKGLATAGQAGAPTADGAGQAATGAGVSGNPPAPVAAEKIPCCARKPIPVAVHVSPMHLARNENEHVCDLSCINYGTYVMQHAGVHRCRCGTSFEAEEGPEIERAPAPIAASSGPNVASMNVPAGQLSCAPALDPPQGAGQPGPGVNEQVWEIVVDQVRRGGLVREIAAGILTDLRAEGLLVDESPKWGYGPLVHHVDEPVRCGCKMCCSLRETYESSRGDGTAEATGGAPPDRVGVSGGKAGPGLTPVSPGPAEPTGGAS